MKKALKYTSTIIVLLVAVGILSKKYLYLDSHAKSTLRSFCQESNQLSLYLEELLTLSELPASRDVVMHGAYFDDRSRKGHSNITMIFLTINTTLYLSKRITGCGVASRAAKDFLLRPTYQQGSRSKRLFPYEQYVLECYDMPVEEDSRAFVTYKTAHSKTGDIVVESDRPVIIPAPRVEPTGKYDFTVATCIKIYDRNVKYLPEFVRYQKTVGVDHVHLSMFDTFIKDGGFHDIMLKDTFLREAIQTGYLSLSVFKRFHNATESYFSSILFQSLGCFYHLRGTYDFISIADPDDFFTPRIPGETQMKYYIQKYCTGNAGSCKLCWRWLSPDHCGTTGEDVGPDGNVTKTINVPKEETCDKKSKSIHYSKVVIDFSYHEAKCKACILPGYQVVEMSSHTAYFAHNRFHAPKSKYECQ